MTHITHNNFSATTDTAITLGNFDGLHLGHQRLVDMVKSKAVNGASVVFSFWPHPAAYLKGEPLKFILTRDEKKRLLADAKADIFVEYPFDGDVAAMPPEIFITEVLHNKMRCKTLVVGQDYRFGKKRRGDAALLEKICGGLGIELIVLPHELYGGEKISSSAVRGYVAAGELRKAELCLGRPYFASGRATRRGDAFVLELPPEKLLPPAGKIYETQVFQNGKYCPAQSEIELTERGAVIFTMKAKEVVANGAAVEILF